MKRGVFITFEGIEGSGKSTQIKLLVERFTAEVPKVLREPGGTEVGEEIRKVFKYGHEMLPITELFLLSASRAQLVGEVIAPALERGEVVICDRFYDSTIAYQGYGRGLDRGIIYDVTNGAVGDTHPDLTIYLAIPLEVSEQRKTSRGIDSRDRIEAAGTGFFTRVIAGFEEMARGEPTRIRRIDGTLPPSAISQLVWQHVCQVLE